MIKQIIKKNVEKKKNIPTLIGTNSLTEYKIILNQTNLKELAQIYEKSFVLI